MERLLDEISFDAPRNAGQTVRWMRRRWTPSWAHWRPTRT
jgi:hypothetical protein